MPTTDRTPPNARRPWLVRAVVALAITLAATVASVGVAAAHANLLTTDPADGQSLAEPPTSVSATFSEPITADVGGLTVRTTDGDRVDQDDSRTDGDTLSVDLRSDLAEGTYVATFRVQSADGHPVSGTFAFGIGPDPVDVSAAAGSTDDGLWDVLGSIARFVTFLSALVASGLALFLTVVHDQRSDRWRLATVVRVATGAGLVGIVATIVVQAALLTGDGLAAATDADVVRNVLAERLGWSSAVLLLGLAAAHLATDTTRLPLARGLAAGAIALVAGALALWGHDTEAPYRWLAVGSDLVHVAAAAVWIGGLVGLAAVLRRRVPHPVRSTSGMVRRFSAVAVASVVALVPAGVAMAWIETGDLDALWSTDYGRRVLLKSALTVVALGIAWYNRNRILPGLVAGAAQDPDDPDLTVVSHPVAGVGSTVDGDDDDVEEEEPTEAELQAWRWRELRRTVSLATLTLVAAVAVTAVLVSTTPGRDAQIDTPAVVNQTAETTDGTVNLVVAPAQVGATAIHVQYADADGRPIDITDTLTIELSLPEEALGPIARQVAKVGPGHFILQDDDLAFPGQWTVTLSARTGDFSEERTSFQVPIAP